MPAAAGFWAAAVERAFEGHESKDVCTFLKLLCSTAAAAEHRHR